MTDATGRLNLSCCGLANNATRRRMNMVIGDNLENL
jgi:hypothetical protein